MELFYSTESHISVAEGITSTKRSLGARLDGIVANSILSDLDVRIRYIPIVMPPERAHAYPARSRVERANRIYNACPQLDYQVFLDGSDEDMKREWISGLDSVAGGLKKLGVSKEHIDTWTDALATLAQREN